MLVINGRILTMEREEYDPGYVWIENGIIAECGSMDQLPADIGGPVLDAEGGTVLPGLIDAHCHLGMFETLLSHDGDEANEDTDSATPQLRAIDGINPMDRCFREALSAGVTTVLTGPGSANAIGGQFAAIKTYGRRIDDMILQAPACIKFALGENPKTAHLDRDEGPVTRMATAAIIRENLFKAQEYLRKKDAAIRDEDAEDPDFDIKLEALIPLLKGDLAAHFHAHRADDIFTAIRISKEFGLKCVIIHGTEGHLIADILAKESIPVITGPLLTDRSKPELSNQTLRGPGVLSSAGVLTAICTDHPETPVQYLVLCAAMATKSGMKEADALRSITIHPARIAGIDRRVGSIAPGKDGDLVIFSGHPFSMKSEIRAVIAGGVRAV
ncbi:amidohydrolase [Papillibacter cinnamivorans]|uniref:Imidazolonepropionase n=1 Tax=Papillibacter cinnamivorans DSM 12816 TaxID=1122930 RepID=A0A1W2A2Y2_9FIRM|nr:amidohydrolase [Papillibacter cinnamivorans]SMC55024.1 Imidazolonepropionase [Papillibacter cinnamivorans DSM 12816]